MGTAKDGGALRMKNSLEIYVRQGDHIADKKSQEKNL